MANVRVHGDYADIDKLFNRLSGSPNRRAALALDDALDKSLTTVKLATHVDTGSLKSSMKADSKKTGPSSWEGTITAGGTSEGVNNPVDYAIYEKERGGGHDFFEPLKYTDPLFVAAMHKGMT